MVGTVRLSTKPRCGRFNFRWQNKLYATQQSPDKGLLSVCEGVGRDVYNLFVSYNWRDREAVESVVHVLKERGLNTFLDRWYLVPGRSWVDALERSLRDSNAVAIFLGPNGMGRWQQREKELAIDRQVKDSAFAVIPVLLPGADPALGFLSLNTWVDLREGTTPGAIEILVRAGRREGPDEEISEHAAGAFATICPYRGLRPFREEDEPFFCGRETFTSALMEAVSQRNLIAVVGASGSGKSSVVRAGLMPKLRRKTDRVWELVAMLPQERPIYSLAACLHPLLEPELPEVDRLREIGKLSSCLEKREIRLRDVVDRLLDKQPGTDRLLLVVDQWEELYTLCRDETARECFIEQLLDAAASERCAVVLTLRADFFGHALSDRHLSDRLQGGVVNIGPMTRQELQRAIVEPAERIGLRFEDGLVGRILDDVGVEPGSLPLLEFLLTELWEKRRSGELFHEAYDAIGGVRRAIAERAEQSFARMAVGEQEATHWALMALVVPGDGAADTRRRAFLEEFSPLARDVIAKLAADRLLVTARDVAGREVVEVGHEALIREWKRLRQWVNDDRDFLRTLRRLEEEVAFWDADDRPADLLLPAGRRLTEAKELLGSRPQPIGAKVRAYVEASLAAEQEVEAAKKRAEERRLSRTRAFAATISGLLLVAVASAFLFFWEQEIARNQTEIARSQTEVARNQTDIARSQTRQAEDSYKAALQNTNDLAKQAKEYLDSGAVQTKAVKELLSIVENALGDLGKIKFTSAIQREQANVLLTVSDVYLEFGDIRQALERANTANQLARQLVENDPDNAEWQSVLYGSRFRIEDILVAQKKISEAREEFDAALTIAEQFAARAPQNLEWEERRSFIHDKIGDLFRSQDDLQHAGEQYQVALTIGLQLMSNDPAKPQWRGRVAASHNRIGDILAQKQDLDGAFAHYRQAFDITERIARDDPASLAHQFTLAVRHSRIAAVMNSRRDTDGALREYRKALEIRRSLTIKDRTNASYQNYLAASYIDIGSVLMDRKDWGAAIDSFRQAITIAIELAEKDKDNSEWQERLVQARDKLAAAEKERGPSPDTEPTGRL